MSEADGVFISRPGVQGGLAPLGIGKGYIGGISPMSEADGVFYFNL
jgi:hypothetical protein